MGTPKNPRKAFRVACLNCHTTQDSLHYACSSCGKPLYSNMAQDEMSAIATRVDDMETLITRMEGKAAPAEGEAKTTNPYHHMDKAWDIYRALRQHSFIPGMPAYLDGVLKVLLRLKVPVMQRTVKANWIFLIVLAAFPLVTLLFGLHWTISALLALPALMWVFIARKAAYDLKRTRDRLSQLEAA